MKTIQDKAMLVRLNISQWTARKHDKRATAEVENRHGTENAGRFNKILIDPDRIKAIQKKANEARTYFYKVTLPWLHDGQCIMPSEIYMEAAQKMQEFEQAWQNEVNTFLSDYDREREQARIRLNGLFSEADYPTLQSLEKKYSFSFSVLPIPSGDDFRLAVGNDEAARIKQQIEDQVKQAAHLAMRDLWSRLFEVVSHAADTLKKSDKVFRNSLIDNIQELVDLIPAMNLTDDPKLAEIAQQAKEKLASFTPDTLRESPVARKEAADNAQSILDAMSGYIN